MSEAHVRDQATLISAINNRLDMIREELRELDVCLDHVEVGVKYWAPWQLEPLDAHLGQLIFDLSCSLRKLLDVRK